MNLKSVVKEKGQLEPYLLVNGTIEEYGQIFLVVDLEILGEVPINIVPLILLSVFFVYNIRYPPGCSNMYSFFEFMFLNSKHDKYPSSVSHFYSTLHHMEPVASK